jgi:hypothetical protein
MRINKWLDFLDRVGWTVVYTGAAAGITALTDPHFTWGATVKTVGIAAGLAVCKVVLAQRAGDDDLGAAVPGKVIEKK